MTLPPSPSPQHGQMGHDPEDNLHLVLPVIFLVIPSKPLLCLYERKATKSLTVGRAGGPSTPGRPHVAQDPLRGGLGGRMRYQKMRLLEENNRYYQTQAVPRSAGRQIGKNPFFRCLFKPPPLVPWTSWRPELLGQRGQVRGHCPHQVSRAGEPRRLGGVDAKPR